MRTVKINDAVANDRRAFFNVRRLDDTPATGEAGGQPQLSINGGSWNAVGIALLSSIGFGNYYADLDPSVINTVGDVILTRYLNPGITQETPGDSFQVVDDTGDGTPTLVAIAFDSYVSVDEADNYFANRLNSQLWQTTDANTKLVALRSATRLIDRLNYQGDKADPNQLLQFPRGFAVKAISSPTNFTAGEQGVVIISTGQDVVIPLEIKIACCEIAYKLLDEVDPDLEIEALNADSQGYANVKTVYNRRFVPEHTLAGIPSGIAWGYLVPFLRDPQAILLSRSS